jgi:RND family efflux transporter MFP subunit
MRAAEAGVAAAQAIVRQRALDLEFTRIRAPITGRISDRRVDVGNIVAANETALTSLLALDPIHFSFEGSEALYLKSLRDRDQGNAGQQVEIKLQDESEYGWKGRVDFTDNALDPRSGTMRGRAVIANPDYFLAPGMFGNMRLTSGGERTALLVPDGAVRTDQARKIVFVVGADGTVAARPVEPGPLVGGLRSIRSGLSPSDRVVISGVQFAMPGAKVNARPGRIVRPAAAPALRPVEASASQATLAAR